MIPNDSMTTLNREEHFKDSDSILRKLNADVSETIIPMSASLQAKSGNVSRREDGKMIFVKNQLPITGRHGEQSIERAFL